MTTAAWGPLGAAAVLAVVDWVAVGRGDRRLEHLAKPATTLLLLTATLVVEPVDPSSARCSRSPWWPRWPETSP